MVVSGKAFFGDAIQPSGAELRRGRRFRTGPRGRIEQRSVFDDYVARLAQDYRTGPANYAVAWDCGNGATGEVVANLVGRMPGRHVLLNEMIDGTFPAHHPDPTVPGKSLELQQAVAAERCDLGIGFDGDGDRIGVVDAWAASCGATSCCWSWRATS